MSRWSLALLLGLPLLLNSPGGVSVSAAIAEPDGTDDAWALIRANTPAAKAVYRPTWLPARFTKAGIPSPRPEWLLFGMGYDSDAGDRLFFGTSANFCGGGDGTVEPITILGHEGSLCTSTTCAPQIWFVWNEGDQYYLVMGYQYNGTRNCMRRGGTGLVGSDGSR